MVYKPLPYLRLTFDKPSVCLPDADNHGFVKPCLQWLYCALKLAFHRSLPCFLSLQFFRLLLQCSRGTSQGAMGVLCSSEHSAATLGALSSSASLHSLLFTAERVFSDEGKKSYLSMGINVNI